jgi:peptidoglycan hydrolase-like protein with peptidoglycan-binding domain
VLRVALFEDTFPPFIPFGSRILRLEIPPMQGTDVAIFQSVYNLMLETMNPPHGPIGQPITVDGRFGPASQQAAVNIQSYFGLQADGVVGPDTYFVFGQGVGPRTTYGGPVFGERTLSAGMSGGDVVVLQNRLNCFRYAKVLGHPATGTFDQATAAALLAFKQDAIANGDTGLSLNGTAGEGAFDAMWLYTFAGGRGLFSGRNGFDVVFVQAVLKQAGFYQGALTGFYDSATILAVRAFQSAQKIGVDGVVGPVTFYALGLQNDVGCPAPFGLAFPVVPPATVTTCTTSLMSPVDPHIYGMASLVINQLEGFESLDVVGNLLPDPSSFGAAYGQYAFTLTDQRTGQLVTAQLMNQLPSFGLPSDWAGAYSPGVKEIPQGTVDVYPTPSGSASGPYGPKVLTGNLAQCH